MTTNVHPTATVSSRAQIGADVTIGPHCVIEEDVEIGAGCHLGPHVVVLRHTTLGAGSRIHAGAVLGDLPQDQAYRDAVSHVKIGARSVIREYVTIHRGTKPGTTTEIGEDCLLMACSHVGHNARLGRRVTLANGALLAGYANIGDQAFVSGNCLVHQFSRIGRLAMMSGGSATQMDVPPFCITRTLSTNIVVGLNVIGLRRAGMSSEERQALKRAFDTLYRSGLSVSRAVELMERQAVTAAERELCQFVRDSKRGICKFIREAHREADADGSAEPIAA
ncbi:MAG: acyl-ACP--UDP-N-acetylglucosamine O-acyltransferase [Planctomycetaceae bacterium]